MSFGQIAFYLVLTVYFFLCALLILVILGQEGKGGGLSGIMSSTVGETFGFSGAATALRKWTRNFSIIFFALTVVLTFWGEQISTDLRQQFLKGAQSAGVQPGMPGAPTGPAPVAPGTQPGVVPNQGTPIAIPAGDVSKAPAVTTREIVITPAPVAATPAAGTPAAVAPAVTTPAATPAP